MSGEYKKTKTSSDYGELVRVPKELNILIDLRKVEKNLRSRTEAYKDLYEEIKPSKEEFIERIKKGGLLNDLFKQ